MRTFSVALLGEGGRETQVLLLSAPVGSGEGEVPGPGDPVLTCDTGGGGVSFSKISPKKLLSFFDSASF